MLSRWLALALSFSIAFSPVSGQAMSTRLFCRVVLQGPKVEVSKDEVEIKSEIETKTLELNDRLQEHWDKQQSEIMATAIVTQKIYDALTSLLIRYNKHSYAFTDLKVGIPQRIHLWVKGGATAEPKTETDIHDWITQYRAYTADRRLLIERMAAIQTEEKILEAAKDLKKYPVDLNIPLVLDNGQVKFEGRHYVSEKTIEQDLRLLKENDGNQLSTFWTRHFANRKSLEVRDREQAALQRHLENVQQELEKLTDGLKDSVAREHMLHDLKEVLQNDDLTPPPYAIFLETRRLFFDELNFYSGMKQTYDKDAIDANSQLREIKEIGLGVDQPKIGIFRKGLRILFITIPLQIPTVFMAFAIPAGTHAYDIYVQPQSYMHTIVDQPDAVYLQKARDFLNARYEVSADANNHVVLSKKGLRAAHNLQEQHEEYKQSEVRRVKEDAALNELLSSPHPVLDPKIFSEIIRAPLDTDAKKMLSTIKATPLEQKNAMNYRIEYRYRIGKKEDASIVLPELYTDFSMEPAK